MMKTQHLFYGLAVIAALFTACKRDKEESEKPTLVTSVMLNYEELILIPGDTVILIATVQPDSANNKSVTWTSTNSAVATVNNDGVVTAIANGEATITATTQDGNKKAVCVVTVDYRSQWIGDYDCEYIRSFYLNEANEFWIDTIQGVMVNVMTRGDSSLYIVGKEEYDVKVNGDGSFEGSCRGYEVAVGNFDNDSIDLEYVMYSPGATLRISYNGKKLKNK